MSNYKFETLQLHVGQEQPDPATDAPSMLSVRCCGGNKTFLPRRADVFLGDSEGRGRHGDNQHAKGNSPWCDITGGCCGFYLGGKSGRNQYCSTASSSLSSLIR